MTYEIEYAYTSHVGKIRANNEDNFWCCGESLPAQNFGTSGIFTGSASRKSLPVIAVFDGMGGESCGEIAAETAVREFGRFYGENREKLKKFPEEFLEDVCESMNREVVRYGEENRIGSMGTTAAVVAFSRAVSYTHLVKTYEAIIKGDNIPEPGIPESFKVLLKELQSLGLDVKVLREDQTEVEIMESVDYGDTDLRSVIEGDSRGHRDEESFSKHGYTQQEFEDGELVDVEEEEEDDFEEFEETLDEE